MPRYRPRKHRPVLAVNISWLSQNSIEEIVIEIRRDVRCLALLAPTFVKWSQPGDGAWLTSMAHPHG